MVISFCVLLLVILHNGSFFWFKIFINIIETFVLEYGDHKVSWNESNKSFILVQNWKGVMSRLKSCGNVVHGANCIQRYDIFRHNVSGNLVFINSRDSLHEDRQLLPSCRSIIETSREIRCKLVCQYLGEHNRDKKVELLGGLHEDHTDRIRQSCVSC